MYGRVSREASLIVHCTQCDRKLSRNQESKGGDVFRVSRDTQARCESCQVNNTLVRFPSDIPTDLGQFCP